MSTAMQILMLLYSFGNKLPQLAAVIQPWIEATATMVAELTAIFQGRSGPALEEPDAIRAGLTAEELKKLEEVEGLAGRSGPGEWITKLLAIAAKYPAMASFILTLLTSLLKK